MFLNFRRFGETFCGFCTYIAQGLYKKRVDQLLLDVGILYIDFDFIRD